MWLSWPLKLSTPDLGIRLVIIFQVLQLKIANNPFAQWFRVGGGNSLRKRKLPENDTHAPSSPPKRSI